MDKSNPRHQLFQLMVYPQVPVLQFLLSGFVTLALIGLFQIATEVLRRVKSPLGDLPGPNSSHWFYGNSKEIRKLVCCFC